MPGLNALYDRYREQAAFYIVYIQEAHAIDAWQDETNVKDGILISSPKDSEQRGEIASKCVRDLGIKLPALVDNVDDRVERAYMGWPDRLYVIDSAGRIAYKSEAGPFGFKPDQVGATLERLLPQSPSDPVRRPGT